MSLSALGWGAAIGTLGGLIGLGGAEFRLPVLLGLFALAAHQAVRLNLLVSLVTLGASAVARLGFGTTPDLWPHAHEIAALTLAAMTAAWFGAGLLTRIDAVRLTRVIAVLLAGIGMLLLVESMVGEALHLGAESGGWWRAPAGAVAGVVIGLVSSLLGVAGGELIIPTLIFGFGLDIRAAGSASLIVSLPAVAVGVLRHARAGGYRDHAILREVAAPMAAGSILGAIAGAALLPFIPVGALKLVLGAILLASSVKLWRKGAAKAAAAREAAAQR
ncbi:sulfite exporter TauE/SafE family protein [Falsiroseomonas tokyonensis]|uniref:Probable membrane transporter protein n=1 Tax=Falsiroseomonas tokyonensis TaxID=430521 RepID=A0ABV7C413_9PROT|nr:sulfite exporter TauE/SafE family protein [Falsiroseomonas tokyonensis]MBU8541629.1 sulfite exporter TauE/SafE family protein [Falsiroseomonas tokyonensis]